MNSFFSTFDKTLLSLYAPRIGATNNDSKEYKDALKRNRTHFYTLVGCFLIHTISFFFMKGYPRDLYMLTVTAILLSLIVIMTVGRDQKIYFEVCVTLLLVSYLPILTLISDNFLFFSIAGIWIIPSVVFLLTQNEKLVLGSSFGLMIFLYSYYKDILISKIQHSTTEELINYFEHQLKLLWLSGIFHLVSLMNFHKIIQKKENNLITTQKGLEMALKNHETFTYSLSHELRNPLNSMIGNLELAEKESNDPSVAKMLKTAQICGDILLQMINNILDSAKADFGNLEVTPVESNIRDTFEKIWTVCREMIKRKGLDGRLYVSNKVPQYLQIDPHRITQILLNLLSNAIKFTDRGTVKIKVKWLKQDRITDRCFEPHPYSDLIPTNNAAAANKENYLMNTWESASVSFLDFQTLDLDGNKFEDLHDETDGLQIGGKGILKISVIDSGCGMSEEALSKLFLKFSQVHPDSNKRKIGTGLGLWITKQIVEKMNGKIRAFSKEGIGTTFVICMLCEPPGLSSPMSSLMRMHTMYSQSKIKSLPKKKLAALVIDDNHYSDITKFFLQKTEVEVVANVASTHEALAEYYKQMQKGKEVNIITMDLDIVGFDAKEACRRIRQFEKDKKLTPTTIIILGSNGTPEEIKEFLDPNGLKANYFRKKPVYLGDFEKITLEIFCNKMEAEEGDSPKPKSRFSNNETMANTEIISERPLNYRRSIIPDKKKRFLVADDDPFNRALLLNYLAKCDAVGIEARDGQEALNIYKKEHQEIDGIFMDYEMDILNGYEASEKIREYMKAEKLRDIFIYGVTGHSSKKIEEKCKASGMNGVITKPVHFNTIKDLVNRA